MEADWIRVVIAEARSRAPEVPDTTWDQLEKHLRGMLSDRPLSAKPLAAMAFRLIEDMSSAPSTNRSER